MRKSDSLKTVLACLLTALTMQASRLQAQDPTLDPTYGSVSLKAGFLPDPFEKKLVAGGPIKTNLGGVNAHVAKAPDFRLHYTAGTYQLSILADSKADTTLLIKLPDGTWVADDDSGGNLNPLIQWKNPLSGRYDIYVGTFGKDNAEATLKITERSVQLAENPGQKAKDPAEAELVRQWYRAMEAERQGKYAESAAIYEQILPSVRKIYGKDGANTATILTNLGNDYRSLGQYAKAESLYLQSIHLVETKFGKTHPHMALPCAMLANLYHAMGQYAKAEPLALQSLQIREAKFGKDHPEVASSLNDLAVLYDDMGQYTRAESLAVRSLHIREARLGKDHPDVAQSYLNLAAIYRSLGQYAKAEPLVLRSLQIFETKLGTEHPFVATTLHGVVNLYYDMRQYAKAEPYALRCLRIREARLGKDHADVASTLNTLANLYYSMGQYTRAEPFYQRSLQICESKLGKDHPDVTTTHHNRASNWAFQKEWLKGVGSFQKASQGTVSHLAEVLPVLSEKEQLTLLSSNFTKHFHRALSLGWTAPREAAAPSAEWLLNGKAIAHQSLAEQHLLARDAKDPKAKQLVEELQQTRSRLASQIHRSPQSGMETEYQQELQQLRTREQQLAQKLARAVGRPYRSSPWVTLDELKARLGPKTAFVDIARFPVFDYKNNQSQGPRYIAWITPPQGKGQVQLIDLGDAKLIDQLVEQTRKTLIDSAPSIRAVGEIEALQSLQKPLQALSARVLHPLLPTLRDYEEWIVCPDGALWLTPWNALLLPEGQFAVERFLIRHVVSGRDLVQELPRVKADSAYLFADPDYDLSPSKVMQLAGSPPDGETMAFRSAGSALGALTRVPRLAGTALEAESVRPKIKDWLGQEPKLFLEGRASETLVKATRNPRVLMLATHGYFLPTQEVESKDRPGMELGEGKHSAALFDKKGQPIENPLLRCGLLLAGCNKRNEAKPGEDDGILTGLEIVGMDLNGCELVVLSACETGLGDVRNGEGVAGLRQAFQLAGAKAVLASLWQVPDRETALLMNGFYGELTRGRSLAQALRQAQLQRIASRREQFGAAHPFFWSAFALTSRGSD